jgi:hypothetical protein
VVTDCVSRISGSDHYVIEGGRGRPAELMIELVPNDALLTCGVLEMWRMNMCTRWILLTCLVSLTMLACNEDAIAPADNADGDAIAPADNADEDAFHMTIDDEVISTVTYNWEVTQTNDGATTRLYLSAGDPGAPDVADADWHVVAVLELESAELAKLPIGQPIGLGGDVVFGENDTYELLDESDISFTPSAESPWLQRAWVRYACFCSRYGSQNQALTGTLTIDAWDGTTLEGALQLHLTGEIPFHGSGFGGNVNATIDALF